MRRYSFTYFISQSVKSLWRNGVMSLASVAVLMSCLIVLGSFVLLLTNVNYNLDKIGILNYIVVFVDTDIDSEIPAEIDASTEENTDAENTADAESAVSEETVSSEAPATPKESIFDHRLIKATDTPDTILWYGLSDEEINLLGTKMTIDDYETFFAECESLIESLKQFTDIPMAVSASADIRIRVSTMRLHIPYYDENYLARYYSIEDDFARLYYRINSLSEIYNDVCALDNIDSVTFTSKTTALEEMSRKYSNYTNLFNRISYSDNPLNDQFTVTYKDGDKVSSLRESLETLDDKLYRVDCREDIANVLSNVKNIISMVFIWFLIILIIVSMFVIINTIKLAVFSRKQEIMVMRYVGATNWFIVLPFILEGILIGLLASVAASFLQYYAYNTIENAIVSDFSFVEVLNYGSLWGYVTLGFIIMGIFTGIVGSTISLRKYLKA